MKKIVILSIITLILAAAISGYFYLQKQLLPGIVADLENTLSKNTPLNFKIGQPKLGIISVTFPRIEINYQNKTTYIDDLHMVPSLTALLDKNIEITGSGILISGKEKLDFRIIDAIYDIKTEGFSLSIEFVKGPVKRLLQIISSITDIELIENIQQLKAECRGVVFLKYRPQEDIDLKTNLYIEDPNIELNGIKFISSKINIDYMLESQKSSIVSSLEGLEISDTKNNIVFIEQGYIKAESDLKTVKLKELKALNNKVLWQGTGEITNLDLHPTLSFNIESDILKSTGELRKVSDTINFKADIYKDRSMLHVKGHYDSIDQDLKLTGRGSANLKTILKYIELPEDSAFKNMASGIKLDRFNLDYNIKEDILTAGSYVILNNLSYNNNIIAQSGSLDLRMANRNIIIENLRLGDDLGSIQAAGNISIEDKLKCKVDIYIKNYEIAKLLKPFLEKDVGNGMLFADLAIKGDLQDLDSLIGVAKWEFREGDLGRFQFLSQIASLINRPGLSNISFKQGRGNFNFKKRTLQSPESILISDHVKLLLSGAVDIDGRLDLTMVTEFPEEQSQENSSSPFGKIGDILSLGFQELFYKIKVTGTIAEPKYTLMPASIDKLLQNIIPN
jgi:hypothetical protein